MTKIVVTGMLMLAFSVALLTAKSYAQSLNPSPAAATTTSASQALGAK